METSLLRELNGKEFGEQIPDLLARNITDPARSCACKDALSEVVAKWTTEQVRGVLRDFSQAGAPGEFEPANLECRELSRLWASHVITSAHIDGSAHLLEARKRGPTVLLANHASYIDSPILDAVIAAEQRAIADNLVHLAGGKVYEAPFRRIAIVSYHSIRVQQSEAVRKNGAGGPHVSPRELARISLQSIASSHDALRAGKSLLIYPEGSRTRDGNMGPFVPGVYRYLTLEGAQIVPVTLNGPGSMMGISGDNVTPQRISVRFGAPLDVAAEGGARAALLKTRARLFEMLAAPQTR